MHLYTTDSVLYFLPSDLVERWTLLRDIDEAFGGHTEIDVNAPFSSSDIDLLWHCTYGGKSTMSKASLILSYFNSSGDESWREMLEVDEAYHDRRSAYLELGLHLRTSGRFRHIHDWRGFGVESAKHHRELVENLDILSLITGIYYSIHTYGAPCHWEAVALYLPSGYFEYLDEVAKGLRLRVASTIGESEFSLEVLRRSREAHEIHSRLLLDTNLGSSRSKTADAFAGIYYPLWHYYKSLTMVFLINDEKQVSISEPLFHLKRKSDTLKSSLDDERLKQCAVHLLRVRDSTRSLRELGLGRLVGDEAPAFDSVTLVYSDVMGYTCHDTAVAVFDSLCNSRDPMALIERRLGKECLTLVENILEEYHGRT